MVALNQEAHYALGHEYELRLIPPVPEHCTSVDAGPVRFVVESRVLNADTLGEYFASTGTTASADTMALDGAGASLHVFGAADELEWLRFDCFDNKPHYHYVRNADGVNQTCRIDDFAIADPMAWAVDCVRTRLPEMLAHAGADDLASAVAAEREVVNTALDKVVDLLDQAAAVVSRSQR